MAFDMIRMEHGQKEYWEHWSTSYQNPEWCRKNASGSNPSAATIHCNMRLSSNMLSLKHEMYHECEQIEFDTQEN